MTDATTFDPAAWTPVIERGFFARLRELLGSDDTGGQRPVHELVRRRLAELDPQLEPLIATAMDAANARFTALAVAGYDVLQPMLGPARAAAIVDDCLNGPLRDDVLAGTRALLDDAGDPFTALVDASRQREQTYFGPSFHFQRPVDDDDTYVLDVRRCFFHEVLRATGRAELQPILCRFDLNWSDAIDPARHRLRFIRPVTFATGTTCRMLFTREEHPPRPGEETASAREVRA